MGKLKENKRYFWIQLTQDFFKSKEMKLLRKMPGGDTYTIIYQKMLLVSLEDGGKIYYDDLAEDLAEEVSLLIDEDIEAVRMTLLFLENKGLLKRNSEKEYFLEQVPEMVGSETASTRRSRKHREQKALQCNTNATLGNGDIDIEKEIDKEKEKNNIYSPVSDETKDDIPYKEIVDYLNDKAKTNYRASGKDTKSHIKARWNEGFNLDDFKTVIDKQVARWTNTEYQQYLRPKTLFGTKFESYLNSPEPKKSYVNEYPEDMPF